MDIVFADSASIMVAHPQHHRVWASLLDERVQGEILYCPPTFKLPHPVHIRWYCGVNYRSPVPLVLPVTGTTGLPRPQPPYMVRRVLAHLQRQSTVPGWPAVSGLG